MKTCVWSLDPPIAWRTELFPGGAQRRLKRQRAHALPSGVFKDKEALAYMYICPITRHYVVAARGDTRKGSDGRHYVCYQTFPQRAAAVMYAQMCGG